MRQGGKWTESDLPEEDVNLAQPAVQPVATASSGNAVVEKAAVNAAPKAQARMKKLSYKFQKEFDELPKLIEVVEQRITELKKEISAADFYSQALKVREEKLQVLAQAELQLENYFERWAELEDLQQAE